MSRKLLAGCIAAVAFTCLAGCAELNRRGGVVAYLEDKILFQAVTKTHRLLRSYALVGAMVAVARRARLSEGDRESIIGPLSKAVQLSNEAYNCLYPGRANANKLPTRFDEEAPKLCIFFDERMTALDYAIYRLAAAVLVEPEGRELFTDLQDKLIGNFPILGPAAKAAVRASDAAVEATTAAQQATLFVNQLLRFSYSTSHQAVYLLPIYRDVLELDMWVVLHSLARRCSTELPLPLPETPPPASFGVTLGTECGATLTYGAYILADGNGNLQLWREFLRKLNGGVLMVQAYPAHFALASQWIYTACKVVLQNFDKTAADIDNICNVIEFNNIDRSNPTKSVNMVLLDRNNARTYTYVAQRARPSRVVQPLPLPNPNSHAKVGSEPPRLR